MHIDFKLKRSGVQDEVISQVDVKIKIIDQVNASKRGCSNYFEICERSIFRLFIKVESLNVIVTNLRSI